MRRRVPNAKHWVAKQCRPQGGLRPVTRGGGFSAAQDLNLKKARADDMDIKISSEEFLRRIDSFGVLKNDEAERTEPVAPCDTKWRKRIENDISFDADRSFQTMQSLDLSNGENARWEILTAEEQKIDARGGNESLMDRYESGSSIHNGYCFHFYFIAIAKGRLRA